jgi:hypothetical protein
VAGATVSADFTVSCLPARARVTVRTSTGVGSFNVHYGYESCRALYDCNSLSIEAGTTVEVLLTPGASDFHLDGMLPGCVVTSPNPIRASATPGEMIDVVFDVTCP